MCSYSITFIYSLHNKLDYKNGWLFNWGTIYFVGGDNSLLALFSACFVCSLCVGTQFMDLDPD